MKYNSLSRESTKGLVMTDTIRTSFQSQEARKTHIANNKRTYSTYRMPTKAVSDG